MKAPSPAAQLTWKARRIPRKAQFSSAPDISAETTDGDSLWASGSHVCSGARPIFVPYPTSRKMRAARSQIGFSRGPEATRSPSTSGICPWRGPEAATARKNVPSSASAIPTEQISRYFQVASRER
jgi:hypothetical protein